MSEFGDKLRQSRIEASLTQQAVADLLGVDRTTISYYETGKVVPKWHTLFKMSELYKVSVDEFLSCLK